MSADGGRQEPTWYTADVARTWEDIEGWHKRYSCLPAGPDCYWIFRGDLAIVSYLLLAEEPIPLVYLVNPFRLDRRLIVQQALFLVSGDIRRPFVENLRHAYGHDEAAIRTDPHQSLLKPDKHNRNRILWELRSMNISTEVLFSDLSGFARSLTQQRASVDIY